MDETSAQNDVDSILKDIATDVSTLDLIYEFNDKKTEPQSQRKTEAGAETKTGNDNNSNTDDKDLIDQLIQNYLPNNSNKGSSIPHSHIRIGFTNLLHTFNKDIRTLLYHQQVPLHSWCDHDIQHFLYTISTSDTNQKVPIVQQQTTTGQQNQRWVGVGEREGKIYSSLVLQRHYGYTHGVGRSGNLLDPQPKAVGSTILAQLTNALVYDLIRRGGSQLQFNNSNKGKNKNDSQQPHSIITPLCTGMSIALVLQTLRNQHRPRLSQTLDQPLQPNKDIVLWSRIDQKSCYKAILAAGLHCIIIPTKFNQDDTQNKVDDSVMTDIDAIHNAIQKYGTSRILAIITTTSCFSPRVPDQVDVVAKIIQEYNTKNSIEYENDHQQLQQNHMYHIINHAYGLQCNKTGKLITRATTIGQVDAIICSVDKNFLVPVSGAIVLSPNSKLIQQIGQMYAGRATGSHIIDLCITILSMGLNGYQHLHQQRIQLVSKFMLTFQTIATKYNERLLNCPTNTISFAMTLNNFIRPRKNSVPNTDTNNNDDHVEDETEYLKSIERDLTQLGAMLFHRCVSGTRVIARNVQQKLDNGNVIINGFGSSTDNYPHAYITAACAIGLNEHEMNEFFTRLDKTLSEFQKKLQKRNQQ